VLHWSLAAALAALVLAGIGQGARADVRSLTLHNLHSEEEATIVFKRDGVYDADGLKALDTFLRDPIDNKSTYDMDPHLFDLVWDVYQQAGSSATIQVLDGYRSPATNAWLRKNSDGVAENSLHMKGQAIDFYIPGVPLAKLRAIGLVMQAGGVGFYPDSGSPFVHLDTGSVRHWPLMTRKQLLAVFPDGKTLDIPADGDPLPGYKQAQAEYNARHAQLTPLTQVASFTDDGRANPAKPGLFGRIVKVVTKGDGAPIQTASAKLQPAATTAPAAPKQPAPVVLASNSTNDSISAPKPNLAPRPANNLVLAALTPAPRPAPPPAPARPSPRAADFAAPELWTAPAVPAALALAMAGKENHQPGSSLPIAPTAVVATVSIKPGDIRTAGVITSAVIRSDGAAPASGGVQSAVLAYAAEATPAANAPRTRASAPVSTTAAAPIAISFAPASSPLLMTALDTQGLRMWMNGISTRARAYALLTMPDGVPTATMLSSAATGISSFGTPVAALRTDRFTVDAR
jgi:uncharacterized protein YcbK (DUF882 family)